MIEAIAILDRAAEKLSEMEGRRVSRSELTERLAQKGDSWLVDAVTSGNGSNTAQAKKPKKQEEK